MHATDYPGLNNTANNPTVMSQYCNGSRMPPEFASMGYQVPPGISDATVPNPVFNLTPAATVDEGNNWINISWGPLALTNPVTGFPLSNYGPALDLQRSATSPTPRLSITGKLQIWTSMATRERPTTASMRAQLNTRWRPTRHWPASPAGL